MPPGVSVSGYQHMSIYANYTGANTFFNMVRVIPAAATKTLKIVFFDVGDVAARPDRHIQVLPPTDSNLGSIVTGCTGAGVANGALTNCTLTNVSSANYQGKQQVITVPIPSDVHLQLDPGRWVLVSAADLVPRRRHGHDDLERQYRRRPDPPDQVTGR